MKENHSQTAGRKNFKEAAFGEGEKSIHEEFPFRKWIGLAMGPLFFVLCFALIPVNDSFTYPMRSALASTGWVAFWWLTEAVPIPAASMLPLLLFPLTGVMSFEETAMGYADSIVFFL